ncbi:MAG: POTRA domain-containing protein [Saprospiraceae bacterium]|nr:POTRA domain-containing protein [Saprospiraceae bacterium]
MRYILVIWLTFCGLSIFGQQKVYLADVEVVGLKHTRFHVVMNELDIAIGDSLDLTGLADVLQRNEQRLLSTGLFSLADINIKHWDAEKGEIGLSLEVKESWYIYPAPIFELADRSFNVWWKEMNCDFDRVNYGIRIDHLNLTGRKDKFKIKFQQGYTRKYELEYNFPYLKGTWGVGAVISYAENKELGFITSGNKVLFRRKPDESTVLRRFRTGLTATKRASAFAFHTLRMEYQYNSVDDVVVREWNPNYYPHGDNYIQFFRLLYVFRFNHTIFPTYPEGGYAMAFEALADGLGLGNYNNLAGAAEFEAYTQPFKGFIVGGKIKAKWNFTRNKIPYSNYQALGYGSDVLRGYELYVMDGTDFAWLKTSARLRLLDHNFNLGGTMPLKAFNVMPVRFFIKFTAETGYAADNFYAVHNPFSNRWLLGYGPGLDLLLYNNFLLSLEYNTNHVGESAFYYKSKFNF